MTSEMMKSSIPSSCGSTREERLAGGGPWCSSWSGVAGRRATAASIRPSTGSALRLDVLDAACRVAL